MAIKNFIMDIMKRAISNFQVIKDYLDDVKGQFFKKVSLMFK